MACQVVEPTASRLQSLANAYAFKHSVVWMLLPSQLGLWWWWNQLAQSASLLLVAAGRACSLGLWLHASTTSPAAFTAALHARLGHWLWPLQFLP